MKLLKSTLFAGRFRTLVLGVLLPFQMQGQAWGDSGIYVDAGLFHDSNLSRASRSEDMRGDGALVINASAGRFFAPTGVDTSTLSLDVSGEAYSRYYGLNHLALGGSASWRHKFGVGYLVPWLKFDASALYDGYRSDIRDSAYAELRAEAGRRLNEIFDASAGIFADRRFAAHDDPVVPGVSGRVFDLDGRGAFLRVGYAPTDRLLVSARAEARRGDVVSTSERSQDIFLAASAIAEDPTFGDELYDYRLRGTTWAASLAASWALTNLTSINLTFADQLTRAAGGLDYRSKTLRLSFTYGY